MSARGHGRGRPAAIGLASQLLASLIAAVGAQAEPFVPDRDDAVLEVLPVHWTASVGSELRAARAAVASDPTDVDRVVDLAWKLIAWGQREGDPRPLGQAESLLAPFEGVEDPPVSILLIRATLRQNRHAFPEALADLERVLARDPRNAQAWLTRAVIEMVQGELASARRSCAAVLAVGPRLPALTCLAQVGSLTGRAERSLEILARAVDDEDAAVGAGEEPEWDREAELFAWTCLGEMAARLGRDREAEAFFDRAARIAPGDAYLLAARADLALDRGRPREVVRLLARATRRDGLLLRLVLAERSLGDPRAEVHTRELHARFEAARERGDRLHLGEEARFELEVRGDAEAALRLARENWALQREPRDARILLEAALAAGSPAEAEPVLAHLERTGLEDRRLARLAARIGEKS
ncbi:tetratricopeptide repeat protein [Myxococcota bacterium]|nr:tetratricopeptide repeat protein [Myxococcota bacterium]